MKKLDEYESKLNANELNAQMNYKNGSKNDFEFKIFAKLVEDHRSFHQKYLENMSHNNILEIIISPEAIQQKIDV